MQRPIMNPTYIEERSPRPRRSWATLLRTLAAPLLKLLTLFIAVLFYDPLTSRRARLRIEEGPFLSRFIRGLLYRLAFVPLFTALTVAAVVYSGTHPKCPSTDLDPSSQGIYYEAVTFVTDDGVRLEGWLVPAVDADVVLNEREQSLRKKHPAVILAHDYGNNRQQMLPLIKPLHASGIVVLAVSMRGGGASSVAGSTFGLHEASDLKAAANVLRKRPYVDSKRIAIVGVGSGANAAILAAEVDPCYAALVLDHPFASGIEAITEHVGRKLPAFNWIRPMCKWAFELVYQVDAEEIDLVKHDVLLRSAQVLLIDDATVAGDFQSARKGQRVRNFLRGRFHLTDDANASTR